MDGQEAQKSPFNFSTPELEKHFNALIEISDGNNLRMKKNLVELIENTRIRIELESKERHGQIQAHNEMLGELKSAFDGLKIQD